MTIKQKPSQHSTFAYLHSSRLPHVLDRLLDERARWALRQSMTVPCNVALTYPALAPVSVYAEHRDVAAVAAPVFVVEALLAHDYANGFGRAGGICL